MKKALVLGALVSVGVLSFGCAMTDYGNTAGAQIAPPLNKSHRAMTCQGNDGIANSQQTIERQVQEDLYYTQRDPITGNVLLGTDGFSPRLTTDLVDQHDAKDWERFNGPYAFVIEVGVSYPGYPNFAGLWILGGMKDLDDGSARINTYYSPDPQHDSDPTNDGLVFLPFSCVGSQVDGMYGGPEGNLVGAAVEGRHPDLRIETVCVDRSGPGIGFGQNIAATNDRRGGRPVIPADAGFSTFLGLLGRGGEGRVHRMPVTRFAGVDMAAWLAGGESTISIPRFDLNMTSTAQLKADGKIAISITGMTSNGFTYTAETPVVITVDPSNRFRTPQVLVAGHGELANLGAFAIRAGLCDRELNLEGLQIPEIGYTAPPHVLTISSGAIIKHIEATGGHFGG